MSNEQVVKRNMQNKNPPHISVIYAFFKHHDY
jgi:hypothetical protein